MDALNNAGPADPSRISLLVCAQLMHPGIDPVTFPQNAAAALVDLETSPSTDIPAEPGLRCYVFTTCPDTTPATASKTSKCKKRKKHANKRKPNRKRKRCGRKKR